MSIKYALTFVKRNVWRIKRVCLRLKHGSLHVPTSTLHLHIPIVHVANVTKRVLAIAVANGKRGNYIHGFLFTTHNNNQFENEISCPEHEYGPINYRAGYAAEVGEHGFKLQTIYHIDNYRV